MAHELGHAVGLHHGGGDGVKCKPNYHSIMNSAYREVSWGGTATLAGTKAGFSDGLFVDMPLIEGFLLESWPNTQHTVDELRVFEFFGLFSPGNNNTDGFRVHDKWVDWDEDGIHDPTMISADISTHDTSCGAATDRNVLLDYDDSVLVRASLGSQPRERLNLQLRQAGPSVLATIPAVPVSGSPQSRCYEGVQ